jgi:hypothetical protein
MTPNLVTVAECRAHSRFFADSSGGPDDEWLTIWIPVVSQAVALWLKEDWRLYQLMLDSNGDIVTDSNGDPVNAIDSNGDLTVHPVVMGAVLHELEYRNRNRGGEGSADMPSESGWGYILGKGATSILQALRQPTVS